MFCGGEFAKMLHWQPVLLAILAGIQFSTALIRIVSTVPSVNNTIVRHGDSATLSCEADRKWFFCLWASPGGQKQCAIQENEPSQVCRGDERLTISGSSRKCDITIHNFDYKDWGSWMCMVTDDTDFSTARNYLALETGVEGSMRLTYRRVTPQPLPPGPGGYGQDGNRYPPGYGDPAFLQQQEQQPAQGGDNNDYVDSDTDYRPDNRYFVPGGQRFETEVVSEDKGSTEDIIHIVEGEEVTVRCEAKGAHPPPTFAWEVTDPPQIQNSPYGQPQEEDGRPQESPFFGIARGNLSVIEPGNLTKQDNGLTDGYSRARFNAYISDNNTMISCIVTQKDAFGVEMYSYAKSARVEVIPLPPPMPLVNYKKQIGIIAGSLIGAIFLLLLCILLIIFVCRRGRKKPNSPTSSQISNQSDYQIRPIWTTKNSQFQSKRLEQSSYDDEEESESSDKTVVINPALRTGNSQLGPGVAAPPRRPPSAKQTEVRFGDPAIQSIHPQKAKSNGGGSWFPAFFKKPGNKGQRPPGRGRGAIRGASRGALKVRGSRPGGQDDSGMANPACDLDAAVSQDSAPARRYQKRGGNNNPFSQRAMAAQQQSGNSQQQRAKSPPHLGNPQQRAMSPPPEIVLDHSGLESRLSPADRSKHGGNPDELASAVSPTGSASSGTHSTTSAGRCSNGSFEAQRSIGEIETSQLQLRRAPTPSRYNDGERGLTPAGSMQETHFGIGAEEAPLTILHPASSLASTRPPSLYTNYSLATTNTLPNQQQSGYNFWMEDDEPNDSEAFRQQAWRKVSATKSEGTGAYLGLAGGNRRHSDLPGSRPASTLGVHLLEDARRPQRISTPTCPGSSLLYPPGGSCGGHQMGSATSSSSVFKCPHDCFIFEESANSKDIEKELEHVAEEIRQKFDLTGSDLYGSKDKSPVRVELGQDERQELQLGAPPTSSRSSQSRSLSGSRSESQYDSAPLSISGEPSEIV